MQRSAPGRRSSTVDLALWGLTIGCAAATLWFSFGAPPPGVGLFSFADKVEHAIGYFATTICFLFAAVWRPGRGSGRFPSGSWWFPLAAIAGGGLIEILQGMTATRTPQVVDLVADVIGTTAALGVHGLVRWRTPVEVRGRR